MKKSWELLGALAIGVILFHYAKSMNNGIGNGTGTSGGSTELTGWNRIWAK